MIILDITLIIIIKKALSMGILKIIFFITTPILGLTVAAFRLKHELPIAARLFGNYIGLSYVYFKSIITYIKPVDHLPFQMISLARKTSQQSQALKRQLKSTLKRVKEDLNNKKSETFKQFQNETHMNHFRQDFLNDKENQNEGKQQKNSLEQGSGSALIFNIINNRNKLLQMKKQNKKSRRFFQEL